MAKGTHRRLSLLRRARGAASRRSARVPAGLPGARAPGRAADRLVAVADHRRRPARCLRSGAPRAAAARSRLGVADRRSRTKPWSNTSRAPRRGRRADEAVHDVLVDGQGGRRRRRAARRRSSARCAASPAARSGASGSRARPAPAAPRGRQRRARRPAPRSSPRKQAGARRGGDGRARQRGARRHGLRAPAPPREGRARSGRAGRSPAPIRRFSKRRSSCPRRRAPRFKAEAKRQAAAVRGGRRRPDAHGPVAGLQLHRRRGGRRVKRPPDRAGRARRSVRKPSTVPARHRALDGSPPASPVEERRDSRGRRAARPTPKPALRAPQAATSPKRQVGADHRRRRVVAARSDRQPAEQGRHAERGPDPRARGRRPRLRPAVGAALRRRPRASCPLCQPASARR